MNCRPNGNSHFLQILDQMNAGVRLVCRKSPSDGRLPATPPATAEDTNSANANANGRSGNLHNARLNADVAASALTRL